MNGITLPTGQRPPEYHTAQPTNALVRHDPVIASVSARADRELRALEQQAQALSLAAGPSQPSPIRTSRSATAAAFIPRTSRNSAGVRKPLSRCTEGELSNMLDRNERLLADPDVARRLPASAQGQLRADTEAYRSQLQELRSIREISNGVRGVALKSDQKEMDEAMRDMRLRESSPGRRPSRGEDTLAIKRRLREEEPQQSSSSRMQHMSYTESVNLQQAAYAIHQEAAREHALRAAVQAQRIGYGRSRPGGLMNRDGSFAHGGDYDEDEEQDDDEQDDGDGEDDADRWGSWVKHERN